MTNGTDMPVVHTIGYEEHGDPASLIHLLQAAGIYVLVDVRELPLSRRRGFSKTALSDALEREGLTYVHMRGLGNPKSYRDLYRNGSQAKGEQLYRKHLRNGSSASVDELAGLIDCQSVCLLCFEADHRTCHRSVIVEELERRLPKLEARHL